MKKPTNDLITVNSLGSLTAHIQNLTRIFEENKYFQVRIFLGKPRSLSLNAVLHRWCNEISEREKEYTPEDVKCINKYHIFMPIQRGEDPEYSDMCEMVLRPLTYEERIKAMRIWPVTRLMKQKPMLRGMEAMQAHCAGRVELEFK